MSQRASRLFTLSFLIATTVIVAALAALGWLQVDRLQHANGWVLHTREVLAQADQLRQLLLDAEAAARGYAIAGRSEDLKRYVAAVAGLPTESQRLARLVRDNTDQSQRVEKLNGLINLRLGDLNEVIDAHNRRGSEASQRLIQSVVREEVSDQIRQALVDLRAHEHELLRKSLDASESEHNYARFGFVLLGAGGALFVVLAWYSCKRALDERAAAERLARIDEARLFSTLQSCGDGLIVTDEAGRVTMLNPVAEALTGWRADQARGAPLDEVFRIVNEFSRETVESPVSRVLREGKVVGLANHTVLLARDGTERPIDDSGAPIRTGDDEIIGVVLVFRDVTARKLSEQARERLLLAEAEREAAVKANETKDQFLALVSHELRSPLAAIHGWVTLLIRGILPPSDVPDALQRIARNVRQQQRVISDLLDVSRILVGKLEIVRAPVDLAAVVRETLDECARYAEQKSITLDLVHAGTPIFISGDHQRLLQIASNIVGNAIKFASTGGSVEVRLACDQRWAIMQVTDDGIGMTAEQLEHAFDRFWQAENATTRSHGGLGLGLALTKYVVDQHEGEVHAESPGPNRGSTITVKLPVLQFAPVDRRDREVGAPAHGALSGVSVLLVEDEKDTRDAVTIALQQAGASVTAMSTVRGALEAHASEAFDVIITDLGMPGDDGFLLAKEVHRSSSETRRETPLIALTGFVGTRDREAVENAGFSAHLEKPIDFDVLVERVRSLIRR